jgi:16S rRNA (guanine527-N7)-methyltransferase
VSEDEAVTQLTTTLGVSRETFDRLLVFKDLLSTWAPKINLVGASTLSHFWARHVLDSAQLLPLAPHGAATWIDAGAGAGFPGLVIASLLSGRPDAEVTLVEPNAKRCAFLREAVRVLAAPAIVVNARIEEISPRRVDVVTARAFTGLRGLLEHFAPWMALGAVALFPKGENVDAEVADASTIFRFGTMVKPSLTDPRGCVVRIDEVQRV